MIGVGLDTVSIGRFRAICERRPSVLERLFTANERRDLGGRIDPIPGLAARFAAKEATMKALGVGIGSFRFRDVEVHKAASGAPELLTSGRAAERAKVLGVRCFHLSLTHTDDVASAIVLTT